MNTCLIKVRCGGLQLQTHKGFNMYLGYTVVEDGLQANLKFGISLNGGKSYENHGFNS